MSEGAGEPRDTLTAVPPGERGATSIADRVVAKVAAQAAREGIGDLPAGAARPHATVVVRHDAAHLGIHVELGYPDDIGARCRRVRHQVARRVSALTGLRVPDVVVRVERLHPMAEYAPGPGRTP